jgi:hypothetical protein
MKSFLIFLVVLVFLCSGIGIVHGQGQKEEIQLSTYYPAPHGTYAGLKTNSLAVGSGASIPTVDGIVTFAVIDDNTSAPVVTAEGSLYYSAKDSELKYYKVTGSGTSQVAVWKGIGSQGTPPGAVMAFAMATAPDGWLECNGQAVSRSNYAALFAAIGTVYGAGDGSTTFKLPDYRGYFLRGIDGTAGNDPDKASRTNRGDGTAGNAVGTKQADAFKSHRHMWSEEVQAVGGSGNTAADVDWDPPTGLFPTTDTGGNETRPKNINVMYCIKY